MTAKNVVKEIIIILLLCLAIILILGVLFYDFNPSSITVPSAVEYATSSNVTQALIKTGGVDESQIVMTYELDSSDMKNYEKTNEYIPGKTNPFAMSQSSTEGTNTTTNNGSTTTGNTTNTSTSSSTNTSSQTQTSTATTTNQTSGYTQDKGTK